MVPGLAVQAGALVDDGFVFFFQAEDGIRDYKVTGVQTCALPIYAHPAIEVTISESFDDEQLTALAAGRIDAGFLRAAAAPPGIRLGTMFTEPLLRSEERRVGKECRSRWSPDH